MSKLNTNSARSVSADFEPSRDSLRGLSRPNPLSYRSSVSAPKLSAVEASVYKGFSSQLLGGIRPTVSTVDASVFADSGATPNYYEGSSVSADSGPVCCNSVRSNRTTEHRRSRPTHISVFLNEVIGCLSEAADSYGHTEPVRPTASGSDKSSGTTKEDF